MRSNERRRVLNASRVIGNSVRNANGDDLGKIEDLMLEATQGQIAYAVLSFGGFLGMGDKLFAIPWDALTLVPEEHSFILNVDKGTLESAPGFDKDNWPQTTNGDDTWLKGVYDHYGYPPYWR